MKIRIPRKLKKWVRTRCVNEQYLESKLKRFYYYLDIERSIKRYKKTPIELYNSFGYFTLDHIVWWNWVRIKYLNLPPSDLTNEGREYFNELMKDNKINILID